MNGSGDAADKFQSTPSAWRETCMSDSASISREFQSTPSAWRETTKIDEAVLESIISIHSLRMEGDYKSWQLSISHTLFQSTPSAWRETLSSL